MSDVPVEVSTNTPGDGSGWWVVLACARWGGATQPCPSVANYVVERRHQRKLTRQTDELITLDLLSNSRVPGLVLRLDDIASSFPSSRTRDNLNASLILPLDSAPVLAQVVPSSEVPY
jgi:hypothetical protein